MNIAKWLVSGNCEQPFEHRHETPRRCGQ